ncbi:MAG TPA: methyltransferase domain-containing protein, partial [Candidatus Limnocylindrales bacterium]
EQGFPPTGVRTTTGNFRDHLPAGPFDGVLAANSLHFLRDPVEVMTRARAVLRTGGRLLVVEYDADRGNTWVPHPFSAARFADLAEQAGFTRAREIGRVPSRFLGAMYAAAADRPDPG